MATTPVAAARKPLVTRFHLLLLLVLVAIMGVAFYKIPEATGLPMHWGLDGRPDEVWPRDWALPFFPVLGLLVVALFAAIGRFSAPERVEPGRYVIEAVLAAVLGLFGLLEFALILIGIGSDVDMVRIVAFGVAGLLLVIGFALPNSAPNAYAGIRLPWTLNDAAAWRAVHRLTGVLYVVAGLGLGAVAIFWPDAANLLRALAVALPLPAVVGAIFSLLRRW